MGRIVHILLLGAVAYLFWGLAAAAAGLAGILALWALLVLRGRQPDEESAASELRNLAAEARLHRLEGKKPTGLQEWILELPWRPGASWEPTQDEVREFLRRR